MNVPVQRIIDGLGGPHYFKQAIRHEYDLIAVIREGLPIASVGFLQQNLDLTNKQMSALLAISESTYQRRLRGNALLTPVETEKALSLAEVYERGIDVFQDKADLAHWLHSQVRSLESQKPIDLLDTTIGRKRIMNVLNAILHGIYL